MADSLKNRDRFSTTIKPDIHKRLKDYSDKTSIPISKLLDKAISYYLDSVEDKQGS